MGTYAHGINISFPYFFQDFWKKDQTMLHCSILFTRGYLYFSALCTIKICTLLKIENNSLWVNFTYFLEKKDFLTLELIFIGSSWRVYNVHSCPKLKLQPVLSFSSFNFMCAAANLFELFCMAYLASNERFLYHSNLSF